MQSCVRVHRTNLENGVDLSAINGEKKEYALPLDGISTKFCLPNERCARLEPE